MMYIPSSLIIYVMAGCYIDSRDSVGSNQILSARFLWECAQVVVGVYYKRLF